MLWVGPDGSGARTVGMNCTIRRGGDNPLELVGWQRKKHNHCGNLEGQVSILGEVHALGSYAVRSVTQQMSDVCDLEQVYGISVPESSHLLNRDKSILQGFC